MFVLKIAFFLKIALEVELICVLKYIGVGLVTSCHKLLEHMLSDAWGSHSRTTTTYCHTNITLG